MINAYITCAMQVMLAWYTLRHLHQRVNEHKNQSSSISKHSDSDKHYIVPKDLDKQFFVLINAPFHCLNRLLFLKRT